MIISLPKITLVISFFLLAGICAAQKMTAISGAISGLDRGSKVYLSQMSRSELLDSFVVTNDSFHFRVDVQKGDTYFFRYTVKSHTIAGAAYLQTGSDVHLSSLDNTAALKYSGSILADEQNEFFKELAALYKQESNLNEAIDKANSPQLADSLKLDKETSKNTRVEFFENWLKRHNESPFSVVIIKLFMQGDDLETAVLERLYNDLSDKAKDNNLVSDFMPLFFAGMRENEALKTGADFKDFTLKDTAGIVRSFSVLKGDNYVLLDFWASWCGPCRASTPEVKRLLAIYSKFNFKVISISADTESEKWRAAVMEDQMTWIQLSDLKGTQDGFMKANNIYSYPTYILVSPQGKIIAKPWDIEKVKEALAGIFKNVDKTLQ